MKVQSQIVILIHSFGMAPFWFAELQKELESKGYIVFSPKLPRPENQNFNESAELIEDLIHKYPNTSINLLGHSMGGFIAAKLAEKYKIDKLILVAPTAPLSKWSEKRRSDVRNWLNGEQLELYFGFHKREIDCHKIIANVSDIYLVFGEQDPYIDETNRNYYLDNFDSKAVVQVFPSYGHMGNSDKIVKFSFVEGLF